MKIRSVSADNHKRCFEVTIHRGVLPMPYSKLNPEPTSENPVQRVYVDPELGREGFTYELKTGAEGSLHIDSVLEYNEDPEYMRELMAYMQTIRPSD